MEHKNALITEEGLDRLRGQLGQESPARSPYVRYVTTDAIQHWCYGIGDDNPLYTNEEYAAKTKWKMIIAPPTFVFTTLGDRPRQGLPGVHSFWSGAEIEYMFPLRAGDKIDSVVFLSAVDLNSNSQFSKRAVRQEWTYVAENQKGHEITRTREWSMRTERDTARETGKYNRLTPKKWTPEEIAEIDDQYAREEIRGAVPRYWEDVQIGNDLPARVKGPLSITDLITFKMGWNYWFMRAHRIGANYRIRHRVAYLTDSLGIPDTVERVHYDIEFAKEAGVPFPYDFGPQRFGWLGHVVTDWMGDDAFITRIKAEIRRFNLLGDCTWCRGKITGKYFQDNLPLVDIELWAMDQRNERTAWGAATVLLPSREKMSSPTEEILSRYQ